MPLYTFKDQDTRKKALGLNPPVGIVTVVEDEAAAWDGKGWVVSDDTVGANVDSSGNVTFLPSLSSPLPPSS